MIETFGIIFQYTFFNYKYIRRKYNVQKSAREKVDDYWQNSFSKCEKLKEINIAEGKSICMDSQIFTSTFLIPLTITISIIFIPKILKMGLSIYYLFIFKFIFNYLRTAITFIKYQMYDNIFCGECFFCWVIE